MSVPTRSALILAGGGSTRLGRDKPLVPVAGRTVLERLLEATRDVADVVVSVREAAPYGIALERAGWARGERFTRADRTARLVVDPVPDLGPVAGLAAGLGAVDAESAVVLAGDLPFVTSELVAHLATALEEAPSADAVVPVLAGRRQSLCAAYRREVAERAATLMARPAARQPSMRELLSDLSVLELGESALSRLGDPFVLTLGIDSPATLERAQRLAEWME